MEVNRSPGSQIYTIGHSNHSYDHFKGLLKKFNIDVVVDTRSSPFSKFSPHFNQDHLKLQLKQDGLKYLFLGNELGGKPKARFFYDQEGYVLYWKIAESTFFNQAVERLKVGIKRFNVALLCSEENPTHCHRRLLIGRVLQNEEIEIFHIRGNACLQTERDLDGLSSEPAKQITFFEKSEKDVPWRSTQSVSQKKPQPTFLNY